MIKEFKIAPEKCEAIIDGVHTGFFKNVSGADELKKDLNLTEAPSIVTFTGALLKSKGIDVLFQSIPLVLKAVPETMFLIVGYPTEEWEDYAKKNDLMKHVRFTGKVDYFDLPKYLSISDIAVDPKVDAAGESSGKIINYMGSGLSVVCFESKNNRKFLADGGFFAANASIEDLAAKIIYALKNPDEAREKGHRNARRVEEVFSWDAGVKKIENIYESLLRS